MVVFAGMGYRPMPYVDSTLIRFSQGQPHTYKILIDSIERYLDGKCYVQYDGCNYNAYRPRAVRKLTLTSTVVVVVVEHGLKSHQTHYRSYRGRVLWVKRPNQQYQSTEGREVLRTRLQSH